MKNNLANFVEELVVSQSGINTELVPFPINGNLLTVSGSNVSIHTVVAYVGDPALEPLTPKNRSQKQMLTKMCRKQVKE